MMKTAPTRNTRLATRRLRPTGLRPTGLFSLLVLTLALSGCGTSEKTRYYLLQPITGTAPLERTAGSEDLSLGIGPIRLPDYLRRPQIISRSGGQELDLAEFDKWAEPLEQNFTRILTENLSWLLSTERISIFPWERSMAPLYQVKVDVVRFEGALGQRALLEARWAVIRQANGKPVTVAIKHSVVEKTCESAGYDALVAAESQAAEDLSREIAEAVKADWFRSTAGQME